MSFHYLYELYYFFRIESDILKIKAEMGTMEKQLSGLMTKSDNSVQNSMKNVKIEQVIKDSLVHGHVSCELTHAGQSTEPHSSVSPLPGV